MTHANVLPCLALASLMGCASQPPADADVTAAERAIDLALRSGAQQWSPREIGLAREKIALTRNLVAARDIAPARWLAQQAQVDAELAALKARNAASLRTAAKS